MAQSYVISGTRGGPEVDGTESVVLEVDAAGDPTKTIGVNQSCELTKANKETLDGLGVFYEKSNVSTEQSAQPTAGTDTAGAGPSLG